MRPGTSIALSDFTPVGGAVLDTGQAFHLGVSARGPVDRAARVRSLRDYERQCGPRAGGIAAHDSTRAFFTEGGGTLYFARLAGDNAAAAAATVGPLEATATSPGVWGNRLTVALESEGGIAGAGLALVADRDKPAKSARGQRRSKATAASDEDNGNGNGETSPPNGAAAGDRVRVVVSLDGRAVERSQLFSTAEQATGWALASEHVRLAADDPDASLGPQEAVSLAGGADDDQVPDTVTAALERFSYALGPGQVSYPGSTDPAVHAAILEHCETMRRVALLDATDSDDPTYLAADALGLQPQAGARLGALLAPRMRYPGPAAGTSVLVPYSAVQGGIIARNDAQTGNPNQPAAGVLGISRGAQALAHDYTDEDRETLNELGVTLAVIRDQSVRTYGSRTVAGSDQPNWMWFGGSRVVMAIGHEADAIAENYVHRQIDGRRHVFSELEAELRALCLRYHTLDALYGETPADAFRIDTGEQINTPETIRAGEIHAAIWLKTAPPGEWVQIEIVRVPIQTPLAA